VKHRRAIGCDLVSTTRMDALLERYARELDMLYTPAERAVAAGGGQRDWLGLAFAAKEAVGKALGTGLAGIGWTEIEAVPGRPGTIDVTLRGAAAARERELGIDDWECWWTRHEPDHLFVVALAGSTR